MSDGANVVVQVTELRKTFLGGDGRELPVLQGVELRVQTGETVAIVGSSGAGKSTLLHLMGALDRPTSGEIRLGGRDVSTLAGEDLARMRNDRIGFVFQFHHLLREFTALENVMMPCLISGQTRKAAAERARELLVAVGLAERMEHRPAQLSGGEQQRVAVARALSNRPLVLLADEPSGNLDAHTSDELHDLLFGLREDQGLAMVLVTHNQKLAERSDRILELREGLLHETVRA